MRSQYIQSRVNEWTNVLTHKETGKRLVFNVIKHEAPPVVEEAKIKKSKAVTTPRFNVDLRKDLPPVYDQGELGSCVSNVACALLAYQYKIKYRSTSFPMFSRLFNYFMGRAIEAKAENEPSYITTDAGLYIVDGLVSARSYGLPEEKLWPYIIGDFAELPPVGAFDAGTKLRRVDYRSVPQTVEALHGVLARKQPVMFGILVYDNFMDTGSDGMVPMPSGEVLGGHALLIVGFDSTRRLFIVRNSWGTSWGDRGYCYMPYDYVLDSRYSFDFYTGQLV